MGIWGPHIGVLVLLGGSHGGNTFKTDGTELRSHNRGKRKDTGHI